MSPGGLSEKQKQKGEMKKKKLRFSSRGSLRCYGPRSLVDEAIWLQAFKKIKKEEKLEMYGYHFFLLRSSSSRRVSSFFFSYFLGAFSLVRFFISYSCLIFYPAADFEHEKKIIINK